ncbi:MAG: hypothetical protein LBB05_03755 [Puniceicoccales bacterium]|nr:hypothetical protein [Puniceicoccales bacterium]
MVVHSVSDERQIACNIEPIGNGRRYRLWTKRAFSWELFASASPSD